MFFLFLARGLFLFLSQICQFDGQTMMREYLEFYIIPILLPD